MLSHITRPVDLGDAKPDIYGWYCLVGINLQCIFEFQNFCYNCNDALLTFSIDNCFSPGKIFPDDYHLWRHHPRIAWIINQIDLVRHFVLFNKIHVLSIALRGCWNIVNYTHILQYFFISLRQPCNCLNVNEAASRSMGKWNTCILRLFATMTVYYWFMCFIYPYSSLSTCCKNMWEFFTDIFSRENWLCISKNLYNQHHNTVVSMFANLFSSFPPNINHLRFKFSWLWDHWTWQGINYTHWLSFLRC